MKKFFYSLVTLATMAMPAMAQEKVDVTIGFENPEGVKLSKGIYEGEKKGKADYPYSWDKSTTSYKCDYSEGPITFFLTYIWNGKYHFGVGNGTAISSLKETDDGYTNLAYKNVKGGGSKGSANFGVVTVNYVVFKLKENTVLKSMDIINSVRAMKDILNGYDIDNVGPFKEEGDFFKVTINGYETDEENEVPISKDIMLAEFKDGKLNAVNDWTTIEFPEFGDKKIMYIEFVFSGNKLNRYNKLSTPATCCIDNIVVSVPKTTMGIENITEKEGVKEVARYAVDGSKLNAPQHGLNIVKMSDGTVRKVMVK